MKYAVIATVYDEVVMPYTNAFLKGPGVTNITLQGVCPADTVDHLGISYDPNAQQLVSNALDPAHAKAVVCAPGYPGSS